VVQRLVSHWVASPFATAILPEAQPSVGLAVLVLGTTGRKYRICILLNPVLDRAPFQGKVCCACSAVSTLQTQTTVHIVWVDVRHMLPMLLLLLLMLFSAPPSAPFFHFWIRQCHLQDGSFS
jgi:hypothetical protein